jgi:hypothetical protein
MIRVAPHHAAYHARAYYCQNCFRYIIEWVRKRYPQFMQKGGVKTAYYATMLGLKPEQAGQEKEMDDRVLGVVGNHDTEFQIDDVPLVTPLSAFIPDDLAELTRIKHESQELLLHER